MKKIGRQRIFFFYLLLFLVNACTASLPPVDDRQPKPLQPDKSQATVPAPAPVPVPVPVPEEKRETIGVAPAVKQPKDEELFIQGMSLLSESLPKNDFGKVKYPLETLVSSYPTSKWRDASYMLLSLIQKMESYHDKLSSGEAALNKTLADKTKTLKENEQLKRDIRVLNEKFQAEITVLHQENEQLKKDILLLKNLEIQLDKREKMLR